MKKKMKGAVFLILMLSVRTTAGAGLIVKTENPAELTRFAETHSVKVEPLISYPDPSFEVVERMGDYYVIQFSSEEMADAIWSLPGVAEVFADKSNRIEPFVSEAPPSSMHPLYPQDTTLYDYHIPNDTYFYYQWDKLITETQWAWELEKGSKDVTVAILDTGIDTLHVDLEANLVSGYNFVGGGEGFQDKLGHGTHVAGIVAAEMDNEAGIAGMCQSWIMALKVVDDDGYYLDSDFIEGICYAADSDADIISMSLIGDEHEPVSLIQDAINYAWDAGCLPVAIAGNGGRNGSVYPGAYEHVMSVGSTTKDDDWASHSNYGDGVTLYAPGQYIYSTFLNDKYSTRSGTSMAGPQVAGLAALVWSRYPSCTNQDVWDKIVESADIIDTEMGKLPRINSRRALDIIADAAEEKVSLKITAKVNRDILQLTCSNTPYSLALFDASGRRVSEREGYVQGKVTLNLSELSRGVYFWSFETPADKVVGKILIIE
ncbi:S8 family serine peptidase [candidate division WOR-3 bacterium]|uniref:S8 family serine peptidase n=1 Tax=candidate division WOR-3 bacterium TaxID=2052148 RepID=A0A9D5K9D2_UNCW3|nr:S8 family serine peptidase [candidate division WOR-3 bacterium]MBD3364733.1 S8 family serine peptidase [candidate division WOR-3 bacterium]